MKKFLIVLLSLGLIAAFSMTASAADVKFSGSYYVGGVFDNNDGLVDTGIATSRALMFQRLRLQPVFQIAEGLTFTARMDAMEKHWGNTNWKGGEEDTTSSRKMGSGAGQKIQESLEFERGYVTFMTGIGQFQVGYQAAAAWGTKFADSETSKPRILYSTKAGPVTVMAIYEKAFEASASSIPEYKNLANADNDVYYLAGIYGFPGGNAGFLYGYADYAKSRPLGYRTKWHVLSPYIRATFGPVYVESEVFWTLGTTKEYDNPPAGTQDLDKNGGAAYLYVKANLGPAYYGGQVAWSQGDNDANDNTDNTGWGGGTSYSPMLMLMNETSDCWKNGGVNTSNSVKQNFLMYQIFGGFKPMPKLNMEVALSFAQADKAPSGFVSKKMGTELDVTAEYKIYDSLTYMVGAAYLWTGDYFKGTSSAKVTGNDYMLINKLTLSF